MPYYDSDGRQLSGPNDWGAQGDWIYTEDGTQIRSERARQRMYDQSAANGRPMLAADPDRDAPIIGVLWVLKFCLFILPVKAIRLTAWSAVVRWRSGKWTYHRCQARLAARGHARMVAGHRRVHRGDRRLRHGHCRHSRLRPRGDRRRVNHEPDPRRSLAHAARPPGRGTAVSGCVEPRIFGEQRHGCSGEPARRRMIQEGGSVPGQRSSCRSLIPLWYR